MSTTSLPAPDPTTRVIKPYWALVPDEHGNRRSVVEDTFDGAHESHMVTYLSRAFAHDSGLRCFCRSCEDARFDDQATEWLNGGLADGPAPVRTRADSAYRDHDDWDLIEIEADLT